MGANGSGKSTLLKILDGLVFPTAGTVKAFGAPLTEDALEDPAFRREFRSRVGFVFQEADVQLFCSNARDELAFGPLQLGLPEDEVERRVDEVAAQLRIEKLLDRPPYSLSGGEKKRVAIASVLTMEPQVLLLDEPSSALDPRSQVWLLGVLEDVEARGTHRGHRHARPVRGGGSRPTAWSCCPRITPWWPTARPTRCWRSATCCSAVNLIHEHAHRHAVNGPSACPRARAWRPTLPSRTATSAKTPKRSPRPASTGLPQVAQDGPRQAGRARPRP